MVGTFRKGHVGRGGAADYPSQGGKLTAELHPSVTPALRALLGLPTDRQPTTAEVGHLLAARTASGASIPGRRTIVYDGVSRRRVAHTDFTFSAPRSFSIALALAPTERERAFLEDCFARANRDLLAHILPLFGHTRTRDAALADVAAITYHHDTSRPTDVVADMNRHSHNFVLHTVAAHDGRVLSANLSAMRGNVKAWGAIGHAYLATHLRHGGVRVDIDPKTGLSRLPDVPEAVVDTFSNRTLQAKRALPPGASPKRVKHQLARTRRAKDGTPDRATWEARAEHVGYVHQSVLGRGGEPVPVDLAAINVDHPTPRVAAARRLIATGVASREAVDAVLVKPTRARVPSPRRKTLPVALVVGETLTVTKRVNARYGARSNGYFASPNQEVTVIAITQRGLALQRADGKIGEVKWETLLDKSTGTLAIDRGKDKPKRRAKKMDDNAVREEFGDYLRSQGFKIQGHPNMNGRYHYVQVDGDHGRQMKGRYIGYLDGHPAGYVNNFRRQISESWKSKGTYQPPSPEQRREQERAAAQREAQRAEDRASAIALAWKIWDRSIAVSDTGHAYLVQKDVSASDLRIDPETGNLIIAMRDRNSKVVNVQRIPPDGSSKLVLKDAPMMNTFGQLGRIDPGKPILIAEGYATAASVHAATGLPVRYAFVAGNLEAVAKITREQFPTSRIVLTADNDHTLPRRLDLSPVLRINIGEVKAQKAAEVVGNAAVIKPSFGADVETGPLVPGRSYPTDYNDRQHIVGKQQLRAELMKALKEVGVEPTAVQNQHVIFTQAQRDAVRLVQAPAAVANVAQLAAQRQQSAQHNRGPEL